MSRKGHFLFSLLLAYIFFRIQYNKAIALILAIIAAYFSSLPDLDLVLGIKHRTITHSLIFSLIPLILANFINNIYISLILKIIGIAIFTHLIGDSFTTMGVMPFYPFSKYKIRLSKSNIVSKKVLPYFSFISFLIAIIFF